VALIVLAVAQDGDTLSVAEPLVLALAAVLLLAGFVLRERRAATPLLDLALFADGGIRAANLSLLAVGAYNAGEILLVTLYLQEGRHLSAVLTGLCFVPQARSASPCWPPSWSSPPAATPTAPPSACSSPPASPLAGLAATRLVPAARVAAKPPIEHKFLHRAGGIP
jgi:hypothetical protein